MKIREFLQDIIDRYSFHYVAWIGPSITFFILFFINLCFIFVSKQLNITTVGAFAFVIAIFTFPIFIPCYALLYTLIFLTLRHNEKINLNFRLKQNAFTNNIFIQLIFILLIILGLAFYLSMLWFTFTIFFKATESIRILAFGFGIPSAILVLVIYSILLKFLHIKSPINWD